MSLDILHVAYHVILPVFLIVSLGALIQRLHALDIRTMVNLIIYVLLPAYVFVRVVESRLTLLEVMQTGCVVMLPMFVMACSVGWACRRLLRVQPSDAATVVVASIFFNAGNLGIPIAELAHGKEGGAIQAIVMIFVGTPTFVFGYLILSRGQGKGWLDSVRSLLKLPYIYALGLALLVRGTGWAVPGPFMECLHRVKDGLIPLALFTLGAQLIVNARWPRWRIVGPVMFCKLVGMPLLAMLVVWGLGIWPWPGAQLILAAAAPTAVNTLLLSIEVDGNASDAADCIFWTTSASVLTLPVVLAILHTTAGSAIPQP